TKTCAMPISRYSASPAGSPTMPVRPVTASAGLTTCASMMATAAAHTSDSSDIKVCTLPIVSLEIGQTFEKESGHCSCEHECIERGLAAERLAQYGALGVRSTRELFVHALSPMVIGEKFYAGRRTVALVSINVPVDYESSSEWW